MRALPVLLLSAMALAGQEKPAGKPDPLKKAREMLDAAVEMMGGVQPQIQVAGMWHVAENYQAFDRKKALEYHRQAWAGVPTLPKEQVDRYEKRLQVEIVRSVAELDPDTAIEMVKQIARPKGDAFDNRLWAMQKIVQVLVEKSEFDKAMAFLEAMGGEGAYAFAGARIIFKALPPADPRRTFLFGAAQAAFNLRPHADFAALIAEHWQDVPSNMATAALRSYLAFILDRKDAPKGDDGQARVHQTTNFVSAKGVASFDTIAERDLFDVMWLVREIDPKRAEEILQKYPNLKASLEAFPKGTASMRGAGAMYTFSTTGTSKGPEAERFAQQWRMRAIMESRRTEVLNAALKEPEKALELVKSVAAPGQQADILGAVARSVAENDPARARSLLNRCIAAMPEIKDPGERIGLWDTIADAASLVKDDKLVWEALDRGLSDAATLHKWDAEDAKNNVQVQEFWPSTLAYRRIVMRATRILNTDAEPLLQRISDPDMNLVARIAMAQALLGREQKQWPVYTPRRAPRKE